MFKLSLSNLTLIAILSSATPFIIINHSVAQSVDTANREKVLRSYQGQNLTQGMVDDWIELGEFLAGSNFTPSEKKLITIYSIAKFHSNPQEQKSIYHFAGNLLTKLEKANIVARTKVKEQLFDKYYLDSLKLTKEELPIIANISMMMKIANRYVKVVATDTEADIVVTQKDLDSAIAGYNFFAKLTNQPLRNATGIEKLKKSFPQMSLKRKQKIAQGESTWQKLQVIWASLSTEEKQKIKNDLNQIANQSEKNTSDEELAERRSNNNSFNEAMEKVERNNRRANRRNRAMINMTVRTLDIMNYQQLLPQIP